MLYNVWRCLKINYKTLSTLSKIKSNVMHPKKRYDVKGKKYISTPSKYYFSDIGLRNARLNFRQQEENHIMENIVYNELLTRGYNVDVGVGVVETREKDTRKQLEVDFVCNQSYHPSCLKLRYKKKNTSRRKIFIKYQ